MSFYFRKRKLGKGGGQRLPPSPLQMKQPFGSQIVLHNPRLAPKQDAPAPPTFTQRLSALVEAENICIELDPLRQKIRFPLSPDDPATIENMAFIFAAAQVMRTDPDQWNQFCLSALWREHRNRPRTNSEDQANALSFVIRYIVTVKGGPAQAKSLKNILEPFWQNGTKAERLPAELAERLRGKRGRKRTNWKIVATPVSKELAALSAETAATIKVVISQAATGHVVLEIQEVLGRETLQPHLL
ncbi:hypothetical protein ACQZ6H_09955 [Agrobacterium fabrum]|uniref:hypothetical protein n=1 Tax=Agrobacterium fabrum TaxID=1176649 RepID=UPI001573A41E|nr:hypothetical protein [Agrobacterium fabrum]WIE29844.1 hypothetical protein G6L42_018900 [Agrobacterium fabrum]WIE45804.1 hypothetical protein G6L76_018915 [Agrobacterium fabrum]